ncbi:MAG: helix-turn-helix domain-containing protein, partial [Rhizobium sp.]
MRSEQPDHAESKSLPQAEAYSIITQLKPFERHHLWRDGKMIYDGGHDVGALSITDLRDVWRCHHRSSFDNIRFKISRQALSEFSYEAGCSRFDGLHSRQGQFDPVVQGLAIALLPALNDPQNTSRLFIDHILLALQSHLLTRYGGLGLPTIHRGGLSNRQLNLATGFLASATNDRVGISEIASQCGLSTSYFIRAFKKSTGRTPHRWLLEHKIEMAKQMLLGAATIAEIAVACGFADQSHLT